MYIKKTRRKRSDGPTYSSDPHGRPWVPTPYDGVLPSGRRTWINGTAIPFEIGADTFYVEPFPLVGLLNALGITDGDQRDWLKDSRVADWVKSNGIKRDKRVI